MARARRAARADGIVRWLLPAAVFHAATVLLAAAFSATAGQKREPAARPAAHEPEYSIDLVLLDDGEGSGAARLSPAPAPFEAAAPAPSGQARAPRGGLPSLPEPAEPSPPAAAGDEPSRQAGPTLSLQQLGIGTNPFLDVAIPPLTKQEQAAARLHAALHPPSLERERQLGLGPAGPIAGAARRLVLGDDTLVETSAVLNVRVDAAGHVAEVRVLDASSQVKAWQMIAARLAQALAPLKLRAGTAQGWGLKLRLASSVQLPSGAAPGMRLGVLGQQVAGSGGPGSTSLELSPTSKLDLKEPIDSVGRHVDDPIRVEVMLLKLRADPSDLGATARRVVEVAVLSIDPPAAP